MSGPHALAGTTSWLARAAAALSKPAVHPAEAVWDKVPVKQIEYLWSNAPRSCLGCAEHAMEYSPDDPAAAFPIGRGRRDCIACLQAEGNDKPTGRMQYLVAEILAHILLSQQGMPITAAVEYRSS